MATQKYYVTVSKDGTTYWHKDAKCKVLHRVGGPAAECADGSRYWWLNGQLHRENGPAIEYADGTKFWFQNGQCHRTDGPAIEWSYGTKSWWQNGQYHRTDGPAIERADGYKFWYINGEGMTEEKFLAATQPVVEMTVADVEKLVGKRVKIVK